MTDLSSPKILVKKSDGTFARMTLDEIKKAKSGSQQPKPHQAPPPHPLLKKAGEDKSKKEFAAPLEEAPKVAGVSTVISQPRLDEADKVIKRLSFNIPPNFLNRLRSLIQLYLKDVRSAEQTKEVARRPQNEGGLALKPEQAEEIIKMGDEWKKTEKTGEVKLIKTVNNPPPAPSFKPAPVVQSAAPVIKPAPVVKTEEPKNPAPFSAPSVVRQSPPPPAVKPKPAVVEPFKIETKIETKPEPKIELAEKPMPINLTHSVKVNMAEEKNNMAAREVQEGKNPGTVEDFLGEKIHTAPVEKKASPLVRDVISEAEEMGPVDEIKKFSLTDFRRLSSNPDEAADRLKQKFINLKDESYLLFLEALKAWRRSPLFVESLKAVEKAMATRQKLSIILLDKNKIQWAEIKALLGMEKELVF